MSIGATIITHNCIERDYCLEEAIMSVYPFCDQIVVCDGESTDGTWARIGGWIEQECVHKIHRFQMPWTPNKDGKWLRDMANAARKRLRTDYHFMIQADEVLHEDSIPEVVRVSKDSQKAAAWVRRNNFWMDHKHMAPPGIWCALTCLRMAPVHQEVVGDAEQIEHRYSSNLTTNIQLFHYGSIRRADGWVKKSREMQQGYWSTEDPIIKDVERIGMKALVESTICTAVPEKALVPFDGTHPKVAHKWLRERGYEV